MPLYLWGSDKSVRERLDELDAEIVKLQHEDCFLAENRHHPEHMKTAAHVTRLIEGLRERAARIEEGLD